MSPKFENFIWWRIEFAKSASGDKHEKDEQRETRQNAVLNASSATVDLDFLDDIFAGWPASDLDPMQFDLLQWSPLEDFSIGVSGNSGFTGSQMVD
jgi:hypothetical protein